MSTFEVDIYARTFFPHLPPAMGRQVASEAVNREVARKENFASAITRAIKGVDLSKLGSAHRSLYHDYLKPKMKNGVLVHRAGRKITDTDVRDAL